MLGSADEFQALPKPEQLARTFVLEKSNGSLDSAQGTFPSARFLRPTHGSSTLRLVISPPLHFLRFIPPPLQPLFSSKPCFLMRANPGTRVRLFPLPTFSWLSIRFTLILPLLAVASAADNIQVFFSPHGGCTEAVVKNLGRATTSILVQAYSFTSTPIAKALADAKKRGVDVQVILDKSNITGQYSSADFVAHANIPTYIDSKHAIAHNKIMIIDCKTVLTGSFNFTKAAETGNSENLLVIKDEALAKVYTGNWQAHLEHSQAYDSGSTRTAKTANPRK